MADVKIIDAKNLKDTVRNRFRRRLTTLYSNIESSVEFLADYARVSPESRARYLSVDKNRESFALISDYVSKIGGLITNYVMASEEGAAFKLSMISSENISMLSDNDLAWIYNRFTMFEENPEYSISGIDTSVLFDELEEKGFDMASKESSIGIKDADTQKLVESALGETRTKAMNTPARVLKGGASSILELNEKTFFALATGEKTAGTAAFDGATGVETYINGLRKDVKIADNTVQLERITGRNSSIETLMNAYGIKFVEKEKGVVVVQDARTGKEYNSFNDYHRDVVVAGLLGSFDNAERTLLNNKVYIDYRAIGGETVPVIIHGNGNFNNETGRYETEEIFTTNGDLVKEAYVAKDPVKPFGAIQKHPRITAGITVAALLATIGLGGATIALGAKVNNLQDRLDQATQEYNDYREAIQAMNTYFAGLVADNDLSTDEIVQLNMISALKGAPEGYNANVSVRTVAARSGGEYDEELAAGYTNEQLAELYSGVKSIIEGSAKEEASSVASTMLKIADMKEIVEKIVEKIVEVEVVNPADKDLVAFVNALYAAIQESMTGDSNINEGSLAILNQYENSILSGDTADELGLSMNNKNGKNVVTDKNGNEYTSVVDYILQFVNQRNQIATLGDEVARLQDIIDNFQPGQGQDISDLLGYVEEIDNVLDQIMALVNSGKTLTEQDKQELADLFNSLNATEQKVAGKYGLDINIRENMQNFVNKYADLFEEFEEFKEDYKYFIENGITAEDYKDLKDKMEAFRDFLIEVEALGDEVYKAISDGTINDEERAKLEELYANAGAMQKDLLDKYKDELGDDFDILIEYKSFQNMYTGLYKDYMDLLGTVNPGTKEVALYRALRTEIAKFAAALDAALKDGNLSAAEKAQLEAMAKDIAKAEADLAEFGVENGIGDNFGSAIDSIGKMQSTINGLQDTVGELNSKVSELESEINSLEGEIAGLESEVARLEKALKDYKANHSHTDAEYQKLADAYAEALADLAEANNKYNDMVNKYNDLLNDYNKMKSERDSAKQALEDYKKNHNHTDAEYDALNKKYQDALAKIADLEKQIKDLNSQLTQKDDKIADLTQQLADILAEVSDNEAFIRELYYTLTFKDAGNMTIEQVKQAIANLLGLNYQGGGNGNESDGNKNKPGSPEYGG